MGARPYTPPRLAAYGTLESLTGFIDCPGGQTLVKGPGTGDDFGITQAPGFCKGDLSNVNG